MRRDLAPDEIETGRWDHLVAADSGRGWSRAMFVVIDRMSVSLNVLCGSDLVYSGQDPVIATRVYNSVPGGAESVVRQMCPLEAG